MEERNYGAEIDELRKAVEELAEQLAAKNSDGEQEKGEFVGHVRKMPNMHPDPHISALMDELEDSAGSDGSSGALTYLGVFASGGRQSSWVRKNVDADSLLALVENRSAERMLSCVGSSERLAILVALMKKPMTVAQLVEQCGFGSTGQVYHHLNPLLAANLVAPDEHGDAKGRYVVRPDRVQGLILLLAGVSDLLVGWSGAPIE